MSLIDTIAKKLSSDDKDMTIAPQTQPWPGLTGKLQPTPDHGEKSYRGSGKLTGKAAVITGGDSGIGRAVAIAFAREAPTYSSPTCPSSRRTRRRPGAG